MRGRLRLLGDAARGLIVGAICMAFAAAVATAILWVAAPDEEPCDRDLVCIPDLGPLIAAVIAVPLAIALAGPLVAWLTRIPRPWLFALPAAWAVVLAMVVLGPGNLQAVWPFNSLAAILLILWVPYGLIAMSTLRP
jgi:hypothetical protein